MDRISEAFAKIPRSNFLPDEIKHKADQDEALPIGFGQTNSQPYTVKMMLRWLDPQPGQKVLDVGSGSGWTTALLATIVGPTGTVYAVEKIPELMRFGHDNCLRLNITNAHFFEAGETLGLPRYAPFDRILVSASAQHLPDRLLDQLKPGGKLIIPVQGTILEITKNPDNSIESDPHPGFVFVPLQM